MTARGAETRGRRMRVGPRRPVRPDRVLELPRTSSPSSYPEYPLRRRRLLVSGLSREDAAQHPVLEGRRGPPSPDGVTLPGTSPSPPSACVPTSKMAATAAVSGVLGRVGWRLLQLRCLPGEVTTEAGRGGERGRRSCASLGLA